MQAINQSKKTPSRGKISKGPITTAQDQPEPTRTAKDSSGKLLHMTNHLRCKFYCINKSCLLRRHLYFWRGMLLFKDATKHLFRLINCFIGTNLISIK